MKIKRLLFMAAVAAFCVPLSAQQSFETPLWPNGAPNSNGDPGDTAKVKVFLPKKETATGRAVVICPGGGYSHLAMNHEGYDWAPFFNNMGIAAVVLKYRKRRRGSHQAGAPQRAKLEHRPAGRGHNGLVGGRPPGFYHCHALYWRRSAKLPDIVLSRDNDDA